MNLLSRSTLAYIRAHDATAAAHLEAAGATTPAPTRHAPRRAVIDNRPALVVIWREWYGRGEPAGDEDAIEGEWEEVD